MIDWWNALKLEYQIFYAIGLVATLILVVQLVLMIFGLDGDGDAGDLDGGFSADASEHGSGMRILSARSVIAFAAGFGWTGVVALRNGLSPTLSVLVAFLVGVILMWLVFVLMRALYNMRGSGTLDYGNAVGAIGNVYIPIPPDHSGPGQIQVMIQGRLKVIQAYTGSHDKIPSNTKVKVLDLIDPRTVLVEPLGYPQEEQSS